MATFFRQFPEEENKKKISRSRKSCSHDYGSRGSHTKTNFLKQHQRAVGRRPASASMAFPLHHCHNDTSHAAGLSRTVIVSRSHRWHSQTKSKARDEPNTGRKACLLTTRSKIFRHCSLTAPRRELTSSGFFFCFFLLSQLSEPGRPGTALSGPGSRLASAMTFSGCDTSPTVDSCLFSICRTQTPEDLGRVSERSLGWTDCRAATLTFFYDAYAEKGRTRKEGRQNSPPASQ